MTDNATALLQHTALPEAPRTAAAAAAISQAAAAARRKQKAPGLNAFVDMLQQAQAVLQLNMVLCMFTDNKMQYLERHADNTPKAMSLVMTCCISASNMVQWVGQIKESAAFPTFYALLKATYCTSALCRGSTTICT